jgi:DMSO/TMAO reductase YedYZ molybdopterin-dependent catalytic subunit
VPDAGGTVVSCAQGPSASSYAAPHPGAGGAGVREEIDRRDEPASALPHGPQPVMPAAIGRVLARAGHIRTNMQASQRRLTAPLAARGEQTVARIRARFHSQLHSEWLAAVMGITLGVSFTVCFVTGMVDYLAQHPPYWFHLPVRPVNFFRVTEGVHVLTGIIAIPLVLAKLWVVYPNFFAYPPVRSVAHALERISLVPLVGGALFELATGVANIAYWYSPMPFNFTVAHFYVAWITIGGLIVHIGAKLSLTRDVVSGRHTRAAKGMVPNTEVIVGAKPAVAAGLNRRGFLAAVGGGAGVLLLTVAGETVAPLRDLALLAPRNPTVGPQSLPVNKTASGAGVIEQAMSADYRLVVGGKCRYPRSFSLDELRSLPQRGAGLPIECVEGWSAAAAWRGVSLPILLEMVGAPKGSKVMVQSIESESQLYSNSVIDPEHAADPDTLLALELNGEVLDLDHGFPVRLIAPDRPGVLQTKWLRQVIVL